MPIPTASSGIVYSETERKHAEKEITQQFNTSEQG